MAHHRRGLRPLLKDDDLLRELERVAESRADLGELEASLGPRNTAMLRYSIKLTLRPADMVVGDVEALRGQGFGDTDILHIAEVVAYYAYVNRIADGLGVLLETEA
ncbi:MAG: putative peroxidase-related enzyme [Planctomycetota bacterium]